MALKINESRYRQMSSNVSGPVGRYLQRQGPRVQAIARGLITQEKLVRTGRYRSSIAWTVRGGPLVLRVGSALEIAKLIEYGSAPHRILPGVITGRSSKAALWWTHGSDRGWFVPNHPLPAVNHPGTRPYMIIHRSVFLAFKNIGLPFAGAR